MKIENKSKNKKHLKVTDNLAVNKRDCEIVVEGVISRSKKNRGPTLPENTAITKECCIPVKRVKETLKVSAGNKLKVKTSLTHSKKSVVLLRRLPQQETPNACGTAAEKTTELSTVDDFTLASNPQSNFSFLLNANKQNRLSLTQRKSKPKVIRPEDAESSGVIKDKTERTILISDPISTTNTVPRTINSKANPTSAKRCAVKMKRLNILKSPKITELAASFAEKENVNPHSNPVKRKMKTRNEKRIYLAPTISNPKESPRNLTSGSPDIFSGGSDQEADIYAFKSQSSQSEREDVAADIIEKLKKEGKVLVTKHRKPGPRKTRKKPAVQGAQWGKVCKALSAVRPNKKAKAKAKLSRTVTFKDVDEISIPHQLDDNHFDDGLIDVPMDSDMVLPAVTAQANPVKQTRNHLSKKDSVNIVTGRKSITTSTPALPKHKSLDRTKLLDFARKFVNKSNLSHSTPNKPSVSFPMLNAANTSANSSPWRVDNERMPRTFYFARTTDQLPSYSSDVLPSSQQPSTRDITKRTEPTREKSFNSSYGDTSINLSDIGNISPVKFQDENSLNLSNIENISPVKSHQKKDMREPLVGINPRKGLADRSPLKAINILNVVTLANRIDPKLVGQTDQVLEKENSSIHNKSLRMPRENSRKSTNKSNVSLENTADKTSDISDLFGFCEDADENDENYAAQAVPTAKLPSTKRLQRKLHQLSRLFPPKPTRLTERTIRSAFGSPKKQQADIRDMVATMKSKPSNENVATTSRLVDADSTDDERTSVTFTENDCTDVDVHLFDDPEVPQLSFNTSNKMRTYERPKRKPKRVHHFVMFSSDSEDEPETHAPKPKRSKPDPNRKELKKFIGEFNSMCEEVDKYELVVEKNTSGKSSDGIFNNA